MKIGTGWVHWRGKTQIGGVLLLLVLSQTALAQATLGPARPAPVQVGFSLDVTPPPPEGPPAQASATPPTPPASANDPSEEQAGCASCGPGNSCCPPCACPPGHDFFRGHSGYQGFYPGRKFCPPAGESANVFGRFLGSLHDCLCCQDPCYEGKWVPGADAAWFVESPRPITQQRIRWDAGANVVLPDRAEYFMARADGQGRGPRPQAPHRAMSRLSYHEMTLYTEMAAGNMGMTIEMPYRSVDPDGAAHGAGFGDMSMATKTLLFDCELLQVALVMRAWMPMGNEGKGMGTGHWSLEPSLLIAIKLTSDLYLQGQIAEWIPIGGDPGYAGAVLHTHWALNSTLCHLLPSVPLIGTFELNTWSFQDGQATDPAYGAFQEASNETYVSVGWGLRLFVCDRIDLGVGMHTSLTDDHFAGTLYRTEFRWRY